MERWRVVILAAALAVTLLGAVPPTEPVAFEGPITSTRPS